MLFNPLRNTGELLRVITEAEGCLPLVRDRPETAYHLRAALDAVRACPWWPGAALWVPGSAARYHLQALRLLDSDPLEALPVVDTVALLLLIREITEPGQLFAPPDAGDILGALVRDIVLGRWERLGRLLNTLRALQVQRDRAGRGWAPGLDTFPTG